MVTMRRRGFTLIELLVVMTIIATLLAIVAPRYFRHVDHAKETALHQTLNVVRDAIDKYRADKNKYPASLEDLVDQHYLRDMPVDPISGSRNAWIIVPPTDDAAGGMADIRSGSAGNDQAGVPYKDY
jgi:general secretion pathway protein G